MLKQIILCALVCANLAIPAFGAFNISSLEALYAIAAHQFKSLNCREMIKESIPENTKTNHAKLHLSLLAANIFVPMMINTLSGIKQHGIKGFIALDNKKEIVTSNLRALITLFKKEEVKEGETPKTFHQKWTAFAQTHKTSAWLIRAQLAALAFSGACGAWAKRYYAIIAKCYATGAVVKKDGTTLPFLRFC